MNKQMTRSEHSIYAPSASLLDKFIDLVIDVISNDVMLTVKNCDKVDIIGMLATTVTDRTKTFLAFVLARPSQDP